MQGAAGNGRSRGSPNRSDRDVGASKGFASRPAFTLTSEPIDDVRQVVAVAGEIDVSTSPQLKSALNDAIASGRTRIVVDLARTSFLDSSGLGALVGTVRRLRAHDGRLAVVNTDPNLARTFEVTRADQLFGIYATREEAVEALR